MYDFRDKYLEIVISISKGRNKSMPIPLYIGLMYPHMRSLLNCFRFWNVRFICFVSRKVGFLGDDFGVWLSGCGYMWLVLVNASLEKFKA
jgi:hypothetical protein